LLQYGSSERGRLLRLSERVDLLEEGKTEGERGACLAPLGFS
jgi:hypothetical protein